MVVVDASDDEGLPSVGECFNVVGDPDMDIGSDDDDMGVLVPTLEKNLERLSQIAVSDELNILARIADSD